MSITSWHSEIYKIAMLFFYGSAYPLPRLNRLFSKSAHFFAQQLVILRYELIHSDAQESIYFGNASVMVLFYHRPLAIVATIKSVQYRVFIIINNDNYDDLLSSTQLQISHCIAGHQWQFHGDV